MSLPGMSAGVLVGLGDVTRGGFVFPHGRLAWAAILEVTMIAFANQIQPNESKHAAFLEMLPRIINYARVAFRGLDPDAKEDALAEVVANCFTAYARLVELGKEDVVYPTVLALYAIRQFRDCRRVGTRANCRDAYTRLRHGCRIERLDAPYEQQWKDQLTDNTRSPVPDQAAFRIDFPHWLESLTARDRDVALHLCRGDRPSEVARRHRISRARVSQLRRELHDDWRAFHGEGEHAENVVNVAEDHALRCLSGWVVLPRARTIGSILL
jgi:hypothetical protein